jgi:single-strand DNA-binding protein
MNQVNLIGRLGSDPEIRYTPKGTAVTNVNLAVDDGWGDKKKTHWIGLVLWDKTAEIAGKYTGKGRQVAISGRLTQEEWEDKETGKKRGKTVVTVERLHLLSDNQKSEAAARPQSRPATTQADVDAKWEKEDAEQDEIPF